MYQNPTLLPQVTNRESVYLTFSFFDDDTGDALDLTGYTFALEIRRQYPARMMADTGYSPFYDIGVYDTQAPILTFSLGSGLTVTGTGTLAWTTTVAQMRTLSPATYDVGMVMTSADGLEARQIMLGKLPVLFGGVS